MAFDILELNGENLRDQPYITRKKVLQHFLNGLKTLRGLKHIQFTKHSESPRLLFEDIIQRGGEGIILKRLDSGYTEDYRSHNWLKVKLEQKAVCEVAGWTEGNNRRSESFGSMVLMQNGKYVGNVGGGFSDHELAEITAHLKGCPSMPKPFVIDEVYTAVKTDMKVLIRFHKRTENGVFRFPSFLKVVPPFFV